MADVVLVNPRTYWDIKGITTRLPLACLYIGSTLQKNGFSVQIIDQRVDDNWAHNLRAAVEKGPLWVGVSSMTGRQIQWGIAASQIVREVNPRVPTVWGGVHPSILPEQTLNHLLVDVVVVGEGEYTAVELSHRLKQHGPNADLHGVSGLVWKKDGKVIRNAPRAAGDMDDWPFLDYSLVDVENYVLSEVPGERSLQLTTSRGCPMHCAYCYLGSVPDGRCYRAESPERTVERIERLMDLFKVDSIHIIDDEFFTQFKRARRVCQLILEKGIKVVLRANCRIDYVNRMSIDDLKLFRQAGFQHIFLGAEAGTDRMLKFIQKGITVADILAANQKLKQVDIVPKFSFMGGLPSESLDEVKATMRLMARVVRENPRAYCTPMQLYNPYPGTPLFDYCLQAGMPMPNTPEEWADWDWSCELLKHHWRKPSDERFLNKAALFTFFLDGKTIAENTSKRWFSLASRLYGYVVRARVRLGFFAFMPEVAAIRWEYHNSQRRKDRDRRNRYEGPSVPPPAVPAEEKHDPDTDED